MLRRFYIIVGSRVLGAINKHRPMVQKFIVNETRGFQSERTKTPNGISGIRKIVIAAVDIFLEEAISDDEFTVETIRL